MYTFSIRLVAILSSRLTVPETLSGHYLLRTGPMVVYTSTPVYLHLISGQRNERNCQNRHVSVAHMALLHAGGKNTRLEISYICTRIRYILVEDVNYKHIALFGNKWIFFPVLRREVAFREIGRVNYRKSNNVLYETIERARSRHIVRRKRQRKMSTFLGGNARLSAPRLFRS